MDRLSVDSWREPAMDPRLRVAVDANVCWYEDLCALHGVGSVLKAGLWHALAPPPPLHSDAVVVEPGVTAQQLADCLADRPQAGVKDSFATLDLSGLGMQPLFSATWLFRPARAASSSGLWTVVSDDATLAEWTARHDTREVLLPGLLGRGHFCILAEYDGADLVAGAVARLGSGAVDVSNVWGHAVDWTELADAVATCFPGRPLVGYERDDALAAAADGGFDPVGELRVWTR